MGASIRQVSTHSRLKAAGVIKPFAYILKLVSTHSRLKAAGPPVTSSRHFRPVVSTHSRLKAAGQAV